MVREPARFRPLASALLSAVVLISAAATCGCAPRACRHQREIVETPGVDGAALADCMQRCVRSRHPSWDDVTIEAPEGAEYITISAASTEQVREVRGLLDETLGAPLTISYPIETIQLRHRNASEMVGLVRSFLRPEDAARVSMCTDARTNRLIIIRADDDLLAEIRALVAVLDVPE